MCVVKSGQHGFSRQVGTFGVGSCKTDNFAIRSHSAYGPIQYGNRSSVAVGHGDQISIVKYPVWLQAVNGFHYFSLSATLPHLRAGRLLFDL